MKMLNAGRPSKTKQDISNIFADKEEMARVNLHVPRSFYKTVKAYALEEDITVKELIIKSLNKYMSK